LESLSKQQILDLLRCARAHRERDWLMILVGYSHGLRASEVTGIKASDIADGHLTVCRLKGSKRTVHPLFRSDEALLDEATGLVEYARGLPGNQRIFPVTRRTFARIVERHAKAAGIPRRLAHPHILKHSIAMQTIHSAGVENLRQFLGHKSGASTMEYLKVSDADAASAVSRALRD
jgi:type 1 fimbriae regulatory protein FimB